MNLKRWISKMSFYVLFTLALFVASTYGCPSDRDMKAAYQPIKNDHFKDVFSKEITYQDINRTISFAQETFERLSTREKLLGDAAIEILVGSPSHEQFLDSYPELEALDIMHDALVAVFTAGQIMYEFCKDGVVYKGKCIEMLKYLKLRNTPLSKMCNRIENKCNQAEIHSTYRSFDGSCNNVKNGARGQSFTVYGRIMPPHYVEGIRELRRSVTKAEMPSAQVISASLYLDDSFSKAKSMAVLYWGQFVEHDLSHTAMSQMFHTGKPIECCSSDGKINNPRYVHPFCLPIRVSIEDRYYKKKRITCLSYVRSIPGIGPECSLSPNNQLNQATHFLDASQIYGTTLERAQNLRKFSKGQLMELQWENSDCVEKKDKDCPPRAKHKPCFKSGDERVNSNYYIAALYTLWHREHNRIASKLAEINPEWNDERIFQEARRIVIAEIQHITYSEWIPEVLGIEINNPYVPNADSLVTNSFATAAIRALQSGGPNKITKIEDEKKNKVEHTKGIEKLIEEMITENYKARSLSYFGEIPNAVYGIDILSFDIQRGRDHGLPTYNEFREYCGLKRAASFADLHAIMSPKTVESLQKDYKSVEDIDFIVGGIAEKSQESLFGPTLSCILKNQFKKTRQADRYFYTNREQPKPFSESQLEEIRKVTFARIICDNTKNLHKIQSNVFKRLSNEKVPDEDCNSDAIPSINLNLWSN